MTRNVRTIAKAPGAQPFPVSMLEMWVVVAIHAIWLIVSLVLY
jgi:hypothetical protein